MFSAARPDSASIPDSTAAWVFCRVVPWSSGSSRSACQRPLDPGQHQPGVAGQLVADPAGGLGQPVQGLRDRARPAASSTSERISGSTSTGRPANPG